MTFFLHQSLHRNSFNCRWRINWENIDSDAGSTVLTVQSTPRVTIYYDPVPIAKSFWTVTKILISSLKLWNRSLTIFRAIFDQATSYIFRHVRVRIDWSFQNCHQFFLLSNSKSIIISNHSLDFFQLSLKKAFECGGPLEWETLFFEPCFENLIVPIFRSVLTFVIHLGFRTEFCPKLVSISVLRVSMENNFLWTIYLLKNHLFRSVRRSLKCWKMLKTF